MAQEEGSRARESRGVAQGRRREAEIRGVAQEEEEEGGKARENRDGTGGRRGRRCEGIAGEEEKHIYCVLLREICMISNCPRPPVWDGNMRTL